MIKFIKKYLKIIVIILIVVFVILALLLFLRSKSSNLTSQSQTASASLAEEADLKDQTEALAESNQPVKSVEVESLSLTDLETSVDFEGVAKPSKNTTIRAAQNGYVERILVAEGKFAKAGQPLIYIDRVISQSNYNLALSRLKNALLDVYEAESKTKSGAYGFIAVKNQRDNALKAFNSEKELFEKGLSSQTQLNMAESAYNNAEALYQTANINLNGADIAELKQLNLIEQAQDYLKTNQNIANLNFDVKNTKVPIDLQKAMIRFDVEKSNYRITKNKYDRSLGKAPFSGYVLRRLVENGQYINNGDGLFIFGDTSTFDINIYLTASDVQSLDQKAEAVVTFDSIPGKTIVGKIKTVALAADQNNFGYRVLVEIKNQDNDIRSGDRAKVSLKVQNIDSQLSVPLPAILQGPDQPYVFIVDENNLAKQRFIETGAVLGDRVLVESGLKVKDKVVVKSHQFLKDGDLVSVKE